MTPDRQTLIALGREAHANPSYPLLDAAVRAEMPAEWCDEYDAVRGAAVLAEQENPLLYGYESDDWKLADAELAAFREKHPKGVILCIILGGIRGSKTEWRSKRLVQNMLEKPNYIAWACHTTQSSSRDAQQNKIYKYIPPEYRPDSGRFRQGMRAKVTYTPWGGFTTDDFALPDSTETGVSMCKFKFYGMNALSLEGTEINEGWMDEESPIEWLEALIGRCTTRNGVVYLTFTAKSGYTPLIRMILDGARTVKEVEAELLPIWRKEGDGKLRTSNIEHPTSNAEGADSSAFDVGCSAFDVSPPSPSPGMVLAGYQKVPKVQVNEAVEINLSTEAGKKSLRVKALIVYFHTANNPYNDWEAFKATYAEAGEETIKTLAYGVPTKVIGSPFPLFRETVHVVSQNFFAEVVKGGGTRYHLVDPTPGNKNSGRNWASLYLFIDRNNRKFYYREWPSHSHAAAYVPGVGDMGPWAVPGKAIDGEKGPAQTSLGWSLTRYRDEFLRLEGRNQFGNQETRKGEEGFHPAATPLPGFLASELNPSSETIFERWMDSRYGNAPTNTAEESTTLIEQMEKLGMRFRATPGKDIDGGLELINNALYYDQAQPISATNAPMMYVVENCPNLVFALKNWTGKDGQHGATKDWIDLLRYAETAQLRYVDEELLRPQQPWLAGRGR